MTILRRSLAVVLAMMLAVPGVPLRIAASPAEEKAASPAAPSYAEPALAPDRAEVAFVSGGDIWTAPLAGGDAHLLISHAADERRPLYSPDGKHLAFVSMRSGGGDIYIYSFASSETRRLTHGDGLDMLDGWSRDGEWIYFHSTSQDIAGMNDIFRVRAAGGTPMAASAERYVNEFFAAAAPDGKRLAFAARGISSNQWWRRGHSHIDETELWLMEDLAVPRYTRLAARGAKQQWPMWSADGKSLYYMSDRSGVQNIWVQPLGGAARQVTRFTAGRVLWPSISYDGKTIVFERDFAIWRLDTASGQAAAISISRRSAPPAAMVENLSLNNGFSELALSPDGKKIVFTARGEVFAASAKDGGTAVRVTRSVEREQDLAWSPDSKQVVYVAERDAVPHIYLYDFTTQAETRLTNSSADDWAPAFSPDGKHIAFVRNARELRVLTLETKQEKQLATGDFGRPPLGGGRAPVWSPDSKWIAYTDVGEKLFANVRVVALEGGESRWVSFLPNVFSASTSWSPDGAFLTFDTGQRTETRQLARVDLLPRAPRFREDQFRELFTERTPRGGQEKGPSKDAPPAKAAPKPVQIVFEDIRRRLEFIPTGLDVQSHSLSPDGKTLLLVASAEGQQNIYTYSLDELATEPAVARQITSTAGGKSWVQFAPDGKDVFFIAQGRIQTVNVENRQVRPLAVTAELDVDFDEYKSHVFGEAWKLQRDHFYDPAYHGVNWEAVRETYAPRIAGARTPDEMRRLLNLMVGELNASHSGVGAPPGGGGPLTGRLGLRFDRAVYESSGALRVTEVIPLGPAAIAGGIKPGDYIVAVQGEKPGPRSNLDEMLNRTIERRIELSIAPSPGGEARTVVVRPVSTGAEKQLLYRAWVDAQRAYVEKASNARLGYVHMPDMGAASLAQLYVDLDTDNHARDGVVIDIRNNNGGFVNVYAIDVLARRPYLIMQPRGQRSAPARSVLGQRALELPTILLTNQHSLSDAEDFTEGYRTLKLGKVVGEPTAGWIVYTSNVQLLDGSTIRLPFMRVTDLAGKDMELYPRPVDFAVERPLGETPAGKDSQLDAAIAELLKQLGRK